MYKKNLVKTVALATVISVALTACGKEEATSALEDLQETVVSVEESTEIPETSEVTEKPAVDYDKLYDEIIKKAKEEKAERDAETSSEVTLTEEQIEMIKAAGIDPEEIIIALQEAEKYGIEGVTAESLVEASLWYDELSKTPMPDWYTDPNSTPSYDGPMPTGPKGGYAGTDIPAPCSPTNTRGDIQG